jgi:hydrogenase maturation protein HypF
MRAATPTGNAAVANTASRAGMRIEVRGQVQGVGFRPFVYRLARELALAGYVTNTGSGVRMEVEGHEPAVAEFIARLQSEVPVLASIGALEVIHLPCRGLGTFRIVESDRAGVMNALVPPDVATCADCLREINDPENRRYHYPFTNCTNCGPRYSIIEAMPYDRPRTTMAGFELCDACRREYEDPADRRFHAQPVACPVCGPHLALWDAAGSVLAARHDALREAAAALEAGRIVALKGLGGFQLIVDAGNQTAVQALRDRKCREAKPFALMFPHLDAVRAICATTEAHEQLLCAPQAPIVLIPVRENNAADIAPGVAPDTYMLGVMLPYTPIHHLLCANFGRPLVVTSGNRGEEPICIDEYEALARLQGIADRFLVHNRPITRQVDDSIVTVVAGAPMLIRRARGYAPAPVGQTVCEDNVIAVGGHLKNTVTFIKNGTLFPSQHIGNLENAAALEAFQRTVDSMERLFEARPDRVVHDLHPDYASTRIAHQTGLPTTAIQHHYAHVLSCMAEHGLEGPVLGVSWDGTGYGSDGTIWGGEFLAATRADFQRAACLRPFRLPGGDSAVRDPRRSALSLLCESVDDPEAALALLPLGNLLSPVEFRNLRAMIHKGFNAPVTTSAGRLFDAMAALCGLCDRSAFEGQAAMRLEREAVSHQGEGWPLDFAVSQCESFLFLDWRPAIRDAVQAMSRGAAPGALARGFHEALVRGIVQVAKAIQLHDIVLTGGCFQNTLLLEQSIRALTESGFRVYRHGAVPPNDGGISVGQAWYQPAGEQKSCV